MSRSAHDNGRGKGARALRELALCKKKLDVMNVELDLYREIGGLAMEGAPRKAMLDRVLHHALLAMEASSGTIYTIDPETGDLKFETVKGPLSGRLKGLRMAPDAGIAGLVAATGKPHVSDDLSKDRHWAGVKAGPGKAWNMLAVPLLRKKKAVGVIEVLNKTGGGNFTRADSKVLSSLANHIVILMERANLFAELDGRVRQLAALNEVGNLLISTLDQSTVRQRTMEAITRLLKAETGSLLLLDRERNELFFEVALGPKGKILKEIRLGVGEGIAGWVARHGRPALINDAQKDPRFQAGIDRKSRFRTRDMACVPVRIKGSVIGVLQAINKAEGSFTKDDLKLFQLLSNQVAIALDNARLYEEIKETFYSTSGALAEAIEKRDPYTGGHTRRVLAYSLAIARRLGLPKETIEVVKLSAVLHDIGKIGIEDSVLKKSAPLTGDEAELMRRHPVMGAEILECVPALRDVVPGMLHHHERYDGTGYPKGYKGEEIPLVARIISVADAYDAMTTTRPYRKGLPPHQVLKEIKRCSGRQFDGRVVKAFVEAFRKGEIDGIKRRLPRALNSIRL